MNQLGSLWPSGTLKLREPRLQGANVSRLEKGPKVVKIRPLAVAAIKPVKIKAIHG